MADFSVTSSTGWGGRIKNSFAGIIFGLILVAGSCIGLWWNEGSAVKRYADIKYGVENYVAADSASVDSSKQGNLVYMTGTTAAGSTPSDKKFGIDAAGTLKLSREVEMYQWKEKKSETSKKKMGGGKETVTTYSYSKEWSSGLEDSTKFKDPDAPDNPAKMRFSKFSATGEPITVGAFTLTDTFLNKLNDYQDMPIDSLDSVAPEVREGATIVAGALYYGDDSNSPQVGDTQVKFLTVPTGDVSIIAEQSGSNLTPHQAKHHTLAELRTGIHSADAMFQKAADERKMMTWIIRGVGFLAMMIGLNLLVRPLTVIADVIPFVGNIVGAGLGAIMALLAAVISFVVIALAWVAYRPVIGISLLVGAAALIFLIIKKSRASGPASANSPALDAGPAGGPPPLS
jgi:hypothetical protein